jgi:hypothetical protein
MRRRLGGTIEDRLSHLFRAVEGACVGLQLNRGRPLELEERAGGEVEKAVNELIDELAKIAGRGSDADKARLAQLQNRLREITANKPSFPTQLLELVDAVGLPDAAWLGEFTFRLTNPRPDGHPGIPRSWASAAGTYRNRIFHAAFIDIDIYDVDNAFAFIDKLGLTGGADEGRVPRLAGRGTRVGQAAMGRSLPNAMSASGVTQPPSQSR